MEGFRQVTEVTRVTNQKPKNTLFVITKPGICKSPASNTYIVFREAKTENSKLLRNSKFKLKLSQTFKKIHRQTIQQQREKEEADETGVENWLCDKQMGQGKSGLSPEEQQ